MPNNKVNKFIKTPMFSIYTKNAATTFKGGVYELPTRVGVGFAYVDYSFYAFVIQLDDGLMKASDVDYHIREVLSRDPDLADLLESPQVGTFLAFGGVDNTDDDLIEYITEICKMEDEDWEGFNKVAAALEEQYGVQELEM